VNLALEQERDHETVDRDRLDQHHAEDEVREHRACGARVSCDARSRVAGREALADAAASGKGAAQLDGRMIDAASAKMAQNVVETGKAISTLSKT